MTIQFQFQIRGLDGAIATLQSLPAEVVSKRGGPVKSALRKGAVVIVKAEKAILQTIMRHEKGEERESTGLLMKSLIATRGKAPIGAKGERYLARVKRATYKRKTAKGKVVTTLKTAQLKEYGSSHQNPTSFIRRAGLERAGEVIQTVETELAQGIERVVKRLAAQNASR